MTKIYSSRLLKLSACLLGVCFTSAPSKDATFKDPSKPDASVIERAISFGGLISSAHAAPPPPPAEECD